MMDPIQDKQIKLALISMLSDPKVEIRQISMSPQMIDISTNAMKKFMNSGVTHYFIEIYKKPKNAKRKKSTK